MGGIILSAFVKFFGLWFLISRGCAQDFGYDGEQGPTFWGNTYHQCVGKHQSPIDIEEQDVESVNLPPLVFENFDEPPQFLEMKNNGHTVAVTVNSTHPPMIRGGPLIGKYVLAQFHWHWGVNDTQGSETLINNSSYPVELHMLFYYYSYGSVESASEHPDGLVVLAFMYSKSQEDNEVYEPLIDAIPSVQKPMTTTIIYNSPAIDFFLPADRTVYFTYGGSLTTPPCSEVVTWIEFNHTIPLSHDQIDVFRQLNSFHGKLSHNFRPPQPLHGRVIRMNVPSNDEEQSGSSLNEIFYRRSSSDRINSVLSMTVVTLVFNLVVSRVIW